MYEYKATLITVVDGDTIDASLDLGMDVSHQIRLRLADVNTPELHDKNADVREKAKAAKQFVIDSLPTARNALTVNTVKDSTEKYGRYLAHVRIGNAAETINQLLVEKGLAVPFMVGA